MGKRIEFKAVGASRRFGGGAVPCHGHLLHNGSVDIDAMAERMAARLHVDVNAARMYAQSFVACIVEAAENGEKIDLDAFSLYLSMSGSIDGLNGRFDPAKNKIDMNIMAREPLKKALAKLEPVNATPSGDTVAITSVVDETLKTEGEITGRSKVFLAGGSFLLDTTKDDEGVWLETGDGRKVARAVVTASTRTTLDCSFPEPPLSGSYRIAVYTRMGNDALATPARARRKVSVR